jgi:hypothetical protein
MYRRSFCINFTNIIKSQSNYETLIQAIPRTEKRKIRPKNEKKRVAKLEFDVFTQVKTAFNLVVGEEQGGALEEQ